MKSQKTLEDKFSMIVKYCQGENFEAELSLSSTASDVQYTITVQWLSLPQSRGYMETVLLR